MLFSNQGSFPPPALPGFLGSTSPSATLTARPAPHGVPVGVCAPPPGLPVLPPLPSSMRAAATTPAEPPGALVARFPVGGSLPRSLGGSASAFTVFGACSAFTRVAARMVAKPSIDGPFPRSASNDVVTSIIRSDCYRLERQLPDGIRTRWGMAPFHGALSNPDTSKSKVQRSLANPCFEQTCDPKTI